MYVFRLKLVHLKKFTSSVCYLWKISFSDDKFLSHKLTCNEPVTLYSEWIQYLSLFNRFHLLSHFAPWSEGFSSLQHSLTFCSQVTFLLIESFLKGDANLTSKPGVILGQNRLWINNSFSRSDGPPAISQKLTNIVLWADTSNLFKLKHYKVLCTLE